MFMCTGTDESISVPACGVLTPSSCDSVDSAQLCAVWPINNLPPTPPHPTPEQFTWKQLSANRKFTTWTLKICGVAFHCRGLIQTWSAKQRDRRFPHLLVELLARECTAQEPGRERRRHNKGDFETKRERIGRREGYGGTERDTSKRTSH